MFKKIVLAVLVIGVTVASGCCNKCKAAPAPTPAPCDTCAAPCGDTCDK